MITLLRSTSLDAPILRVRMHQTDPWLLCATHGGSSLRCASWDRKGLSVKPVQMPPGFEQGVIDLAIQPGASTFALAIDDHPVECLELRNVAKAPAAESRAAWQSEYKDRYRVADSASQFMKDMVARMRARNTPRGPMYSRLAYSPDARWLAANAAGFARTDLFDVSTGKSVAQLALSHGALAWHPSSEGLACIDSNDESTLVTAYALTQGEWKRISEREPSPYCVGAAAFTPDGEQLVLAGGLDEWSCHRLSWPKLKNLSRAKRKRKGQGAHAAQREQLASQLSDAHWFWNDHVALSSDGRQLAAASPTGSLQVVPLSDKDVPATAIEAHQGPAITLGVSRAQKLLCTGGLDGKLCVWSWDAL